MLLPFPETNRMPSSTTTRASPNWLHGSAELARDIAVIHHENFRKFITANSLNRVAASHDDIDTGIRPFQSVGS